MSPNENEPGVQGARPTEAELSERRNRLARALEEKTAQAEGQKSVSSSGTGQGFAQAMKLSTEFVAGVLVGAAIGWMIDKGFGTSPWGLIVFLLLGFVAGVLNVLRSAGLMAEQHDRTRDG
jgi:ATP synthase protein I